MRITVWDLPTRLFHWLLVASVAACAVTGFLLPAPWLKLHFLSGFLLGALLLFRLVWAFFGPEHSRWPGFLPTPGAIAAHLKGILAGKKLRTLGHNPAGGAMVLALLLTLTAITVTGFCALGGLFKQGPLAFALSYAAGGGIKDIHELLAYGLLALAAGHVTGVLVESRLLRESLILTMITGKKDLGPGQTAPFPRHAGAFAIAGTVLAAGIGGALLLAQQPPKGWHPLEVPAAYTKECGACHMAYHPSLLPAAAWTAVMSHLDDHYGEDASLPAATGDAIASWLTANASEQWDTLAANRLRTPDLQAKRPISGNAWWKRKHRHIADTIFQNKTVKTHSNCAACHGDAAEGLFAPQAIAIPKEPK
ncbi:MAG TPA: cytochrome b/b6 domain-containing protein [Candidatus Sulfotelmatobacter sp.]|nr:cytochrome b/b6 domain-containing protein [Candidatus Sulfotelmatobacter sp.]